MPPKPDPKIDPDRKFPCYFPWTSWRRAEQRAIAFLVVAAMAVIVLHLGIQYWISQGFVDIDAAQRDIAEFRADLNSADWPELANLPGFGETLARRIVDYRRQHGPFRSVEELENVRGIGPRKLARIRIYLLPIEPNVDAENISSEIGVSRSRKNFPGTVSAKSAVQDENRH